MSSPNAILQREENSEKALRKTVELLHDRVGFYAYSWNCFAPISSSDPYSYVKYSISFFRSTFAETIQLILLDPNSETQDIQKLFCFSEYTRNMKKSVTTRFLNTIYIPQNLIYSFANEIDNHVHIAIQQAFNDFLANKRFERAATLADAYQEKNPNIALEFQNRIVEEVSPILHKLAKESYLFSAFDQSLSNDKDLEAASFIEHMPVSFRDTLSEVYHQSQEKVKIQQQEKELQKAKQIEQEIEIQKQQRTQLATVFDGYRKRDNSIDSFLSFIEQDTEARYFRIADKDIQTECDLFGVDFFRPLSFSMLFNPQIVHLQIIKFYLGDDELILLAEMVRRNRVLRILEFQSNLIGDKGAIALGKVLELNSCPSLSILHLEQNQIGDQGAVALAQGLRNHSNLQILHISSNKIKDDGAIALSLALKENSALQELYFSSNQIQDEGATALGEALKVNSTLVALDVSFNHIGNDGSAKIGEGLKLNSSLKNLNIAGNKLENNDSMGTTQWMMLNDALQGLNLDKIHFHSEGAQALKKYSTFKE
ncbi:unnamed protein product [Blepharisma stoltei]|uniref:Uncharacterized protein n=1 Tax=Blepharisma stoltei TaxID=1481888 RepID=A0AAU9K6N8_9CILI|nr:unnamed protein product [Blepharisma stoltei]